MRVDAAIEWRELTTQYISRERLAADDLSGRLQQNFQQIELDRGQTHRLALTPYGACATVHLDIANHDRRARTLRIRLRLDATQDCADPRDQFLRVERLCQVIIGSHFQAEHTIKRIT